jgi:hypothetical protein
MTSVALQAGGESARAEEAGAGDQDAGEARGGRDGVRGRGLHSSTSQLNLSRLRHKTHPKNPLIPPDNP